MPNCRRCGRMMREPRVETNRPVDICAHCWDYEKVPWSCPQCGREVSILRRNAELKTKNDCCNKCKFEPGSERNTKIAAALRNRTGGHFSKTPGIEADIRYSCGHVAHVIGPRFPSLKNENVAYGDMIETWRRDLEAIPCVACRIENLRCSGALSKMRVCEPELTTGTDFD